MSNTSRKLSSDEVSALMEGLQSGEITANSGLKEITIDQSLLNIIPTSIKKTLIDNFTTWAENVTGFEKFENLIKKYKSINKADLYTSTTPQEVANEMAQTDNRVVSEFEKLDKWILTDTNLFVSVNNTNESISESDINTYLDVFKTKFKITEKNNTNGEIKSVINSIVASQNPHSFLGGC